MKPELTGQGLGASFFSAILAYAAGMPDVERFRLTVAEFNERALTLYEHFGFRNAGEFVDTRFDVPYRILLRLVTDKRNGCDLIVR